MKSRQYHEPYRLKPTGFYPPPKPIPGLKDVEVFGAQFIVNNETVVIIGGKDMTLDVLPFAYFNLENNQLGK